MKFNGNIHRVASLIRKLITGEANKTEKSDAEALITQNPPLQTIVEDIKRKASKNELFAGYDNFDGENAYNDFLTKAKNNRQGVVRRKMNWVKLSAAASILLVAGSLITYFSLKNTNVSAPKIARVIEPGSRKGVLEFAGGKTFNIEKGNFNAKLLGINITYKNGVLSYEAQKNDSLLSDNQQISGRNTNFHKFITPRGGDAIIKLSDGSKITLNASSQLIYPVRFTEKDRLVVLNEGEAFFEVAKDAEHPFIVRTAYGDITVLGTSFNVSAYHDNSVCYTTLVTGKVKIITNDNEEISLVPGEQAIISKTGVTKKSVDVDNYTSWTTGTYTFRAESLKTIMNMLERWYNIRVDYQDASISSIKYTGNVKRDVPLNTFLEAFELSGDVGYEINNRVVTLYRKNK